mgnify:CR=1 FL=1
MSLENRYLTVQATLSRMRRTISPDTGALSEEELGFYMLGVKRQTKEEVSGVVHG